MFRALIVALIALLASNAPTLRTNAQEATPTPPGVPVLGPKTLAERHWEDITRIFYGEYWGLLLSVAYGFDSHEHAVASLSDAITYEIGDFGLPPRGELLIERVAAPAIGDESQAWEITDMPDEIDDYHSDVGVGFVFKTYVVILVANSTDISATRFVIADLVEIAQRIVGREPGPIPPYREGDITKGGLFDLLPGLRTCQPE